MKKKMSLTTKILLGLLLGLVTGLILYPLNEIPFVKDVVLNFAFTAIGKIFINGIKLMVVPLVFVSLVAGTASMGDVKKLGRVGFKTMGFYLTTTAIAITIAIVLGIIMNPGQGLDMSSLTKSEFTIAESKPFIDILVNMVTTNPIESMAKGDMLQIILFAILFGTAMTILGDKATKIREIFDELNEINLKVVGLVMLIAPYGVFCLIAKTFATLGYTAMQPIMMYMVTVLLGLLLHALVTYQGLLMALGRLNPIQFYKKFWPAMSVAFSTSSSNATLPVTLECAQDGLGCSKQISAFTVPLGATINMDGTAIMQGVACVFISQVYGVELGMAGYLTIILTATLASIGTAGVPGVGLIMLSMVLTQVGLPVEGIALIIGIDRILDMCRTVVNITGDAVCTVLVSKSENEFDINIFNDNNTKESFETIKDDLQHIPPHKSA